MKIRKLLWIILVVLALIIGMYPLIYVFVDDNNTLLATKTSALRVSATYIVFFYSHITFGGIALLTGWSQFSNNLRAKRVAFHRWIGKVYVLSVIVAGVCGLFIAFYATAGIVAVTGFVVLASGWLLTTTKAFFSIRNKKIDDHETWMIRSYALTLAAVTLRLWLPLFQFGFGMDFFQAYKIIAWLCWLPNALVAEWLVTIKRAN